MSQASEVELLMLGLINEERTSRGLDPLVINADLNKASEDHSAWMLDNDVFSHTGAGGSSATQRIEDADYALEGSWRTAENIGWQSERGAPGIADDVRDIHEGLMDSPGHRANILNPELEDIGIGVERGDLNGFDAVMITQNFGTSDAVKSGPAEAPDPDVPMADADDPAPAPIPVTATPPEDIPEPPVASEMPIDEMDDEGDRPAAPAGDDRDDCPDGGMADVFAFFGADCFGMADDQEDPVPDMTFEGTIISPDRTQMANEWASYEALLLDMFAEILSMGCGGNVEFV